MHAIHVQLPRMTIEALVTVLLTIVLLLALAPRIAETSAGSGASASKAVAGPPPLARTAVPQALWTGNPLRSPMTELLAPSTGSAALKGASADAPGA